MGHLTTSIIQQRIERKAPLSSPPAVRTVVYDASIARIFCPPAMIRFVVITYILSLSIACQLTSPLCLWAQISSNATSRSQVFSSSADWLTGKALHQRLNSPVSVSWTDAPMVDRLRAFAASKQLAVFIDRRVDPNAKVNLRRVNVTIEQLLLDIADEKGIGTCQLDDLIYFGPLASAYELPILWNDLPRMTSQPAGPIKWEELSRPSDLLASISNAGEFNIDGLQQVRHDLWRAGSLPPLTPIQQVAILAVGFDLWPTTSAKNQSRLTLRKFTASDRGQLEYIRSPSDSSKTAELKREMKVKFPELKLQVSRTKVRMDGTTDQLYAAKSFLIRRNRMETPDEQDRRFSLKTSATRLQILSVIARQTGKELIYDASLQSLLDQQVEIECHQVNLDELVDQILTGSQLDSETTSAAIQILSP